MSSAATQKSEPSPVPARNDDSPARKCRVSRGFRSRATTQPATDRTAQANPEQQDDSLRANRPANVCVGADVSSAQAERSSAAQEGLDFSRALPDPDENDLAMLRTGELGVDWVLFFAAKIVFNPGARSGKGPATGH